MKKQIQPILEIVGKSKPVIGIVGATHGNESGPAIIEKLKKELCLKKGSIKYIIANPEARKINVRFIDSDLNRSFPGKKNGNKEERLARQLIEIGKDIDLLIDLHSCSMESKPFCIVRSFDGEDMKVAKMSGLPFIVVYPLVTQGGASFIDYVKCGVGMELGLHGKKQTIYAGINAAKRILSLYPCINTSLQKQAQLSNKKQKILKVTGYLQKEKGVVMSNKLQNFKLVKKGTVIASKGGKEILADRDFYPVLYKEKSYTTNNGWMAEEVIV